MTKLWVIALSCLLAASALAQPTPPEATPTNMWNQEGRRDAQGGQAVDPTRNVLDLVEAAIRRQDDLRAASDKFALAQLESNRKISEMLYAHVQELALERTKKVEDEAKLRSEYDRLLVNAEAKRIDAIRAVDVGALANTSQRTTEQATALASVVNQSAEVLRNQVSRAAEDTRALVATTAATALQNQQQQFSALTIRIAALEQAGNEQRGRSTIQDPAYAMLLQEVRGLKEASASLAGKSTGQGDVVAYVFAGIGAVVALGGLFFAFSRQSTPKRTA